MCRFLLARALNPRQPIDLLTAFAQMAQGSQSAAGDWQGDGWGMAWVDPQRGWQVHKSLRPIWEEQAEFKQFPATRVFAIHARSASFPQHKEVMVFNQPYITAQYAFVFNGLLKGIKLPQRVAGVIGAQKLWGLLQGYLETQPPALAMQTLYETVAQHSQEIRALNLGLMDRQGAMVGLSVFAHRPAYYQLQQCHSNEFTLVCSQPLPGYPFAPMTPQVVTAL
jgi:predicted glutamine amidotransferase